MDRFRVEVISKTPNPQQVMYAALHQDYSEGFVFDERETWPDEQKCGETIIKRLLAGDRGHYGPLEHVQIVFNCGYFPHSVMQQARTHRTGISFDVQCLAADTEITFVDSQGQSSQRLKKTIGELYDLWVNGEKAIRQRSIRGRNGEPPGEYRRDCKKRIRKMSLRVLNEESGLFEEGHIEDVMCSGLQPIYRVTLEDGKTLDCTVNHRLFTSEGWQTMGEAVGLVTRGKTAEIAITKPCYVMCNGKIFVGNGLYRDKEWLKSQIETRLSAKEIATLSECSSNTVRDWARKYGLSLPKSDTRFAPGQKPWNSEPNALYRDRAWLEEHAKSYRPISTPENWATKPKPASRTLRSHPVKVIHVEYLGEQMTYDLEVQGPWHNFVANGMVVHNSMRYSGLRVIDVADGTRDIEDIFYLRPVGDYEDRQGKKYHYSQQQRSDDLNWCLEAAKRYKLDIEAGISEEHARGKLPFDYRQHFIVSFNLRSLLHFCDLRHKKNAQLEIQQLCELMWPHVQEWVPAIAQWYEKTRLGKARLAP
jgi:thymidylate synthase (FAD)